MRIRLDIKIKSPIEFIKDFIGKRSKLIGKRIKIIKGKDYKGRTGVIEYCDRCCHSLRIQFDNIGNNERYNDFKDKLIFLD